MNSSLELGVTYGTCPRCDTNAVVLDPAKGICGDCIYKRATSMVFYDECSTISDEQLEEISKMFTKASKVGLNGFFHSPGEVVARVANISSPSRADGSFTVTLTDIKPQGRKALGL